MERANVITVSFVHGYDDLDINLPECERPALWEITREESKIYEYVFPRNPNDFENYKDLIVGPKPLDNSKRFKKLPRFGFTGLTKHDNKFYAGSWNSVYEIDCVTKTLKRIISNNLMSDLHGICVTNEGIISVLTGKDTVVITDFDGALIDYLTIKGDLSVIRDDNIINIDWRFISKQFRGSSGYWHFNYIQRFDDEIWLTSRNTSSFVIVDIKRKKAYMKTMNLSTPNLLHDGLKYNDKFYFTSVDGKIIIAEESRGIRKTPSGEVLDIQLYNRSFVNSLIRLNETELKREPNWCRGIACWDEYMYVAIDGRYDSDLSFRVLCLNGEGKVFENHRLKWSEISDEKDLRYVTGFDIIVE